MSGASPAFLTLRKLAVFEPTTHDLPAMNPLLFRVALTLATLLGCSVRSTATTIIPPTLDELVERSDTVVRTHATATRCEWRGEGEERRIVTIVSFAVDETIVGATVPVIELEFLGGEIEGERMIVAGQTRFAPGHEDILFVSRERGAISPLVRMTYGRYLVAERDDGSRLMARADGTPLLALDQISAPLGRPPTGEALAMALAADSFTPDEFADVIRESARRQGRTDVSVPRASGGDQ